MNALFSGGNDLLRDGLGLGFVVVVIAVAQWLGAAFAG